MRLLPITVCVCLCVPCGAVYGAAPKQCDPKDPKKCSQPLTAGEIAPFEGILLTQKLAINLGQKADSCEDVLKLEIDRVVSLAKSDKDLAVRLVQIERDATQARIDVLKSALKSLEGLEKPPAWYERPPTVAAATALFVTGLYVLAVKTVELVQ